VPAEGLAEIVSLVLLLVVLAFGLFRPHQLPELAAAAPAAGLVMLLGLVPPSAAGRLLVELGPTVAFLAAILLLGRLAEVEVVFGWLGSELARHSRDSPVRLLQLTVLAAAVTTAVLSLDATVVLLTPVVLATARLLGTRARPPATACAHLANSASLLLPVSNLTNLLAFAKTGLSFAGFAAVMAGPWLLVVAVEYLVLRLRYRTSLRPADEPPAADPDPAEPEPAPRTPWFALGVLGTTLAGFGVSSLFGIEPVWVALLGASVLGVRSARAGRIRPIAVLRAADPAFCLFVLALGVVVQAVASHGLGAALAAALPTAADLGGLLLVAALAAGLANLLNNLPATLLLLAVLGDRPEPGVVLAVLIGVNVGPNLTYVGSLATLLWRRVLDGTDAAPGLREFTALGALTVPPCLLGAVITMWATVPLVH
jgi:arsenical pump membrane protein